jgi:hypothetical protein
MGLGILLWPRGPYEKSCITRQERLKNRNYSFSRLSPLTLALPIQWIFSLLFIPPYHMENMEMKNGWL